jgi:hypothetical protein
MMSLSTVQMPISPAVSGRRSSIWQAAEAEYTVFTGMAVKTVVVAAGKIWMGTDDGMFNLPFDER